MEEEAPTNQRDSVDFTVPDKQRLIMRTGAKCMLHFAPVLAMVKEHGSASRNSHDSFHLAVAGIPFGSHIAKFLQLDVA